MKKPNMIRVLVTTVSMAVFALAPWPANGQATTINPAPSFGATTTAPHEEHLKVESGNIWIRQPGQDWVSTYGTPTVGHAVKALRTLYPDATFAVDPRVAELRFTDLIVRANDPKTDLQALCTACGGRFNLGGGPNSLYTLQYNSSTESTPTKKEDRDIECFNLTGYLERITKPQDVKQQQQTDQAKEQAQDLRQQQTHEAIDELQTIIGKTINDFDDTIAPPHFQFYPQAQLLIVTGSRRAIEVAAKVIHALPGQQGFFGNAAGGGDLFRNNFSPDSQVMWQQLDKIGQRTSISTDGVTPVPVGILNDPTAAKPRSE
jgi:hypothetical protein